MSIDGKNEGSDKSADHVRSSDRVSENESIGDSEQNSIHKQAKTEYMKAMHDGSCGGMPVPGRADIEAFQIVDGDEPIASTRPVKESTDGVVLAQNVGDIRGPITPILPIQDYIDAFGKLAGAANKVIEEAVKSEVRKVEHPHRYNIDEHMDYDSCDRAYKESGLEKYGVKKSLIAGVLRNEQHFYQPSDDMQDGMVKAQGEMAPGQDWTIGPAQMKASLIKRFVNKYPDLQDMKDDPLRKSLLPENAPRLVSAYFRSVVENLEAGRPAIGDVSPAVNAEIAKLWKNPDTRTEALIRAFNANDKDHLENVKNQMKQVDSRISSGKKQ
ncbi:hypothetical protein GC174_08770 [bacterium]|nr:hypothetical protein [bacterium]